MTVFRRHSRVSGGPTYRNLITRHPLQYHGSIHVPRIFKEEEMDCESPCVYLLASKPHGVLYIGVTSDLKYRIWQHKQKLVDGFSKKYNADRLVWYEQHVDIYTAITREKQIKKWNRDWKIELIESSNPDWTDLYLDILG
jgi:putative endonuclease